MKKCLLILKSETADAEKLEVVLAGSLEQIHANCKISLKFLWNLHVTLTPKQRTEIIKKVEEGREHSNEQGFGANWDGWGRYQSFWNLLTEMEGLT